tara:strand:+ start:5597 stop:6739 length:1143 start_codon:yes stop_codon:yes gene_type:complete
MEKKQRIDSIDALRGFALLGILWVNIYVFHAPYAYYPDFYGGFKGIDELLVFISSSFIAGKFMFIFAFLFGYGANIQYRRMANDSKFGKFWNRRMVALAGFGIIHLLFFWFGDILLPYALLGFLIPFLLKRQVKTLLILGVSLYFSSVAISFVFRWFLLPSISIQSDLSLDQFIEIYSSSMYWELLPYRLQEFWSLRNEKLAFYLPKELALFCFGIAAGKLKLIETYRPKWLNFLFALVIILLWYGFRSEYFEWYNPDENPLIVPFLIGQNIVVEILLGLFYILGFTCLFHQKWVGKILQFFIPVGRTSLSNYFLQSLVCVFLFYGYGLGWYGSLRPIDLLYLTIGIFIVEVILSTLWLQKFKQGPLEWLWRKWSYKGLQ